MLYVSETNDTTVCNHVHMTNDHMDDCEKTMLAGGYRLPGAAADAGKVVLGGGYRLPGATADAGKVVLGGGFRLPTHTN